jgi:hypothetical protein
MAGENVGRIAFYVGLAIAIIAGWVQVGTTGLVILAALGLVAGFLNVTGKEVDRFLLSTVALVIAAVALKDVFGAVVERILLAFIAFTAAAALVVALKEVYSIQKER